MFKRTFVLFLPLVIAACTGKAEPTSAAVLPTSTAGTTASPPPSPAVEPTPASASGIGFVSECTLVSSLPEAPSEFAELFGVTAEDWVDGPDTAALTIVEYGDFQ